ncbi:unnamed protein product [Fusarium venenatum]|uniref:C2H2-type domain-containing protein n=1 Tax=Fusarium venenatum TaxID=56646 RepID=A0A2L2T4K2_9HYPO|nr:uncharacterized protein FVRRES_02226 [Fusarium venenatum]KAH7004649.1 hypothetical protein EDB82DRAFT_471400 [Fusarium venenatum]CEI65714.1 unnamed protein product [Fusarium venenatum]
MTALSDTSFAMFHSQPDAEDYARYADSNVIFTSGPMDVSIPADAYGFQHQNASPDAYASSMGFVEPSLYAEAPNYMLNSHASPSMYTDESSDMRLPSSSLSTASAPSTASSAIGSPQSHHGQMGAMPEWTPQGLGLQPTIVGNDYMGSDFASFPGSGMEELSFDFPTAKAFVDPSLIHPELTRPPMGIPSYDTHYQHHNHHTYPASPSASASSSSPQPQMMRTNSSSPFLQASNFQSTFPSSPYCAPMDNQNHIRAPSISQFVPPTPGEYSSDESKEKQRCTWPDCGKTFKDLKAHMLTHQNERPEKCPIQTCEYHTKGFARKYDKNRHTLTHYKGTMVCGFCPGSGSAAEKSFNRADVFKRHLTAVHGVEQTPPNSRKKAANANANANKKLSGYASDATGKCSTCSQTFSNAQDFYEHLDDCVLRIVQQEDPAEAINAKRLAEVENDKDVHQTLEKNNLPTTTDTIMAKHEDDDSGDEDEESSPKGNSSPSLKRKGNPVNGVQKSRGVTHSRGGVALGTKSRSRKNRRDYPSSWGFDKGQMTMKKRVVAVFDGPRRLAKDDMMLSTDHEVRIKLSDGKSYVTDLDVQTLNRAAGFHGATEEEKGPWISDDPTPAQLKEMQQMLANNINTTL